MKKIALIIAVAGILGISSCVKCNSCTLNSNKTEYCPQDHTSAQIDAVKAICISSGGDWE